VKLLGLALSSITPDSHWREVPGQCLDH